MPAKVLDSFALIAYFRDEPGAEEELLRAAAHYRPPLGRYGTPGHEHGHP